MAYLFESMVDDHCAICVGNPGEKISDRVICLLVDLVLRLGNRFYKSWRSQGLRNDGLANNFAGLFDDRLTKMVSSAVDVFGYLGPIFLLG